MNTVNKAEQQQACLLKLLLLDGSGSTMPEYRLYRMTEAEKCSTSHAVQPTFSRLLTVPSSVKTYKWRRDRNIPGR